VNTTSVRQDLVAKFNDKEYRDSFVAEQIFSRLPLKIRYLREEQKLTQKQLGTLAGMAQTWVSKLEDPNYGKLTISTLLKIASALDVGLQIDFVSYSKVLDNAMRLTGASFSVPRFENDHSLSVQWTGVTVGTANPSLAGATGNLIPFPYTVASTVSANASAARSAPLVSQVQARAV